MTPIGESFVRDPTCTLCPLSGGVRSVCIAADGPLRARLLVVGEAPGSEEDEYNPPRGRPFVGDAGRLLRPALDALGVEYRLTNIVRCRPPDNRKPLATEWEVCRRYLQADVDEMPGLEVVVLLGGIPCTASGIKGPILGLAGIPLSGPYLGRAVSMVPLAHPGYLLRNPGYLDTWQSHWSVVRTLLSKPDDPARKIGARLLSYVEKL